MTTPASLASITNHQVRLAQRPVGSPTRENWSFTTEPVAEPGEGALVIQTLSLSLDPAMRGWMNEGKSYIAPVGIGEVMRAGGIGKVVASANPKFKVGDLVSGSLGVQEYLSVAAEGLQRAGLFRIDTRLGSIHQWLNVLGMPG
ncbi:MAG: NADP-dependent oxidoreductase, partial [Comamonadaceae bacterium]